MTSFLCVFLVLLQDTVLTVPASDQPPQTAETLHDAGIHAALRNRTELVRHPTISGEGSIKSEMPEEQIIPSQTQLSHSPIKRTVTHVRESPPHLNHPRLQSCQMYMEPRTVIHDDCSFKVQVKTCRGHCQSRTVPVTRRNQHQREIRLTSICNCCRPLPMPPRKSKRRCNGKVIQLIIPNMTGCECRPCPVM